MAATRQPAYRKFLARLIAARTDADMTQRDVARHLRTSQTFVSKCETGDRRVDVLELKAFARLYSKPVQWFLDDQ